MASGPTLPPQAYTREILTAAFNWLQSQPESVRKLATTPDALVGLYMRAQRFGASSLEADAPVSSQSFMSDLKNLAEGLKQFENSQQQQHSQTNDVRQEFRDLRDMRRSMPQSAPSAATANHAGATAYPSATTYQPSVQAPQPITQPQIQQMASQPPSIQAPANFPSRDMALVAMSAILNDRSLAMIQDVKAQLNLSSDAEAVNMMISLAYKSLKNLIV